MCLGWYDKDIMSVIKKLRFDVAAHTSSELVLRQNVWRVAYEICTKKTQMSKMYVLEQFRIKFKNKNN